MEMPARVAEGFNNDNDDSCQEKTKMTQNDNVNELDKLTEALRMDATSPEAKAVLRMVHMTEEELKIKFTTDDRESVQFTDKSLRRSACEIIKDSKVKASPSPISITASTTEPETGYLHNMTCMQREKLFQLWGMLLSYFKSPYDPESSKKRKDFSIDLLKSTQQEAHESFDATFKEEESTMFEMNPLTEELFSQCGTDDPDKTLLRFLRARKWVVSDAFNMLTDALKWRHTVGLRKMIVEGERRIKSSLLEEGKNFFWKKDKKDNLVCYIRSRLHDKSAQTLQESIDFTVYTVEWGRRLRDHDDQRVSILFDLKDAPFASLDIGVLQFMIHALQSFYPEILGQCFIKDAPWIFSGFWKLVRPLLDPVVANKIAFVKQEDLPEYIEKSNIPTEYGGDDPYVFKYVHPDAIACPKPISEERIQMLLVRIQVLKARFIESTREMYIVISRVEDVEKVENLLVEIRERRDEAKKQICNCYRELDRIALPKTYYHRISVLDQENMVNWDGYIAPSPPPPEIRMSAPPILSPHVQFES